MDRQALTSNTPFLKEGLLEKAWYKEWHKKQLWTHLSPQTKSQNAPACTSLKPEPSQWNLDPPSS
jgi:hypothetical protein